VEPRWRNILCTYELLWILDHKVQVNILWLAAGYIVMALQACQIEVKRRDIAAKRFIIWDMSISQALIIPTDGQAETLLCMWPQSEGTHLASVVWYEFKVFSVLENNTWTPHCHGLCKIEGPAQANAIDDSAEDAVSVRQAGTAGQIESECTVPIVVLGFYKELHDAGLEYGPAFCNIISLKVGESGAAAGSLIVLLTTPIMAMEHADPVVVYPAMLDSSFHPIFAVLSASYTAGVRPMVPSFVKKISISNVESLSEEGREL
jgi:acyl transferase domain-containing protein